MRLQQLEFGMAKQRRSEVDAAVPSRAGQVMEAHPLSANVITAPDNDGWSAEPQLCGI